MTFAELLEAMKGFENTEEYKNYIAGLITDDRVKEYLATEAGKKLIQPDLDKYLTKGLETWKTNNLTSLLDAEIKKRFPETDPKDTELANMKAQIAEIQQEAQRKELIIKAQAKATADKLPVELISHFIGKDEDETNKNIDNFKTAYLAAVSSAVDEKMKDGSYVPPEGKGGNIDGVTKAFMALNPDIKLN